MRGGAGLSKRAQDQTGPGFALAAHWMMKKFTYDLSRKALSPTILSPKLPFSWPPSIPVLIPHRIRRKLRSRIRNRQSPSSSLASLQTSFRLSDTLRTLRGHRWSVYDAQYLVLTVLGIFALSIIESPGPLAKTAIATLLLGSLLIPITRQFFLPLLPIICWLVFFDACGYVLKSHCCWLCERPDGSGYGPFSDCAG